MSSGEAYDGRGDTNYRPQRQTRAADFVRHWLNTMNDTTLPSQKTIQLVWDDDLSQVTVTPQDKDRFTIKMRTAVEVLQQSSKREQFESQFNLLVATLVRWIEENQDKISKGYITLRDGSFAFIVVRSECRYDDEFEDALSALDQTIANDVDLDLIDINVMALPPVSDDAMSGFLDPRVNFLVSPHVGSKGPRKTGKSKPRRSNVSAG